MSDTPNNRPEPNRGLNPSLRERKEESHDTRHSTPSPAESASVKREGGNVWPIIWLVVTILAVAVAVYLLFL